MKRRRFLQACAALVAVPFVKVEPYARITVTAANVVGGNVALAKGVAGETLGHMTGED